MAIDKANIKEFAHEALAGLKDFQKATVDVVHSRLFHDDQKSMLIADEVGLGKTIVAKGVIAKELLARLESGKRSRFKVTYICSNQVIAGENIQKLNLFPDHAVIDHIAKRIAFLAYQYDRKDESYRSALTMNTLTPGTSFNVSNNTGTKYERAIIYSLLCEDPEFAAKKNGLSCLLRGSVRQDTEKWRGFLEYHRNTYELQPDLADRYMRILSSQKVSRKDYPDIYDAYDTDEDEDLRTLTYEFAKVLRVNNETYFKWVSLNLIKLLRRALIDASLKYVDADLYILDEFQRFRNLIDPDNGDEEALIAQRVFGQKRARVLILSATPFKAFTGDLDNANGEDHYKDFRTVLRFLTNDNAELLRSYDMHRGALYRQLLNLRADNLDLSTNHREEVEKALRSIICRTERNSVATDPQAMIEDRWRHEKLPFGTSDITNFVGTDQIAQVLARVYDRGRHAVSKPVEYCKSAPYPLSFLDGYVLKKVLLQLRKHTEVRKAVLSNRNAWVDLGRVNNYSLVVGTASSETTHAKYCGHARLAQLIDSAIGERGAELLWVPPSMPYYPLQGAFLDSVGFSKTLVFSAWVMVPRMIASMVSYEVERRTIGNPGTRDEREKARRTYFDPENVKNYRRHPAPLLNFARSEGRDGKTVRNMSNFGLLYPSPSLCRIISTRELLCSDITEFDDLRLKIIDRIEGAITKANLRRFQQPDGESEKWYWAAPLLLDRENSAFRRLVGKWLGNDGTSGAQGVIAEGSGTTSAKADHFEELHRSFNTPNEIGLGRMPSDLADVLADMVLGSPAVLALRSIKTIFNLHQLDPEALQNAATVAGEMLNLFNKPESITSVRLGARDGSYWHQVLRYCASGCLQAVFDEYLHLLKGQSRSQSDAIKQLVHTVNISTASINVDGCDSFIRRRPQKMRCHYAVEFGNQKIETDEGQQRASNIRANFNSPFRPFVLATTSIGQEGLDFHQYCRRIVHWNLPGNPIDLEQREGRINRYKGLVVRQQLAKRYRQALKRSIEESDPWESLFRIAGEQEREIVGKCELVPFWHVETDDIRIERMVPVYPFSRDQARLDKILKTLAIYRLAFGQPRQVELVEQLLERNFSSAQIIEICNKLMVNLCPITYEAADNPQIAGV